ncbi:MAG TPA: aminodeoxychorismate synthase component I [Candidatus Omnitrophota bacterium]|nr:aminodeoxychorismate synthase component I [Candidatus Omnitrophota bacterium]
MTSYLWKCFDLKGRRVAWADLLHSKKHPFFLDSGRNDPGRGRYSFMGFDPFDVFIHQGADTLDLLQARFYRCAGRDPKGWAAPFSPLTSGIVGCLGYDYGLRQEKIKSSVRDELNLPDAYFGFYDGTITIDHFAQKLYITSSGLPEQDPSRREKKASSRLEELAAEVEAHIEDIPRGKKYFSWGEKNMAVGLKSNFRKEEYIRAVEKALEHIACGDIYQVNLSQRFECDLPGKACDLLELYGALRDLSPAPFGGYMDAGDFQLISNSPERFLQKRGGLVRTRPMKGTRPRAQDPREDAKMRQEISQSPKEKAELLMITDLLRNDLGRVCAYGSVRVEEMRTIEEYEYVFQATSTVEGLLEKDKDAFDLLRACFPGGSITGCPKIRAMEIIEDLEPARRGMYTGSMGYINFDGGMDLNILIRTLLARRGKIYFHVGSGIVADSDPEKEYEETMVKARSLRAALGSILCRPAVIVGVS